MQGFAQMCVKWIAMTNELSCHMRSHPLSSSQLTPALVHHVIMQVGHCLHLRVLCSLSILQELYGVRSDLGNLFKALGRLEDAKVSTECNLPFQEHL